MVKKLIFEIIRAYQKTAPDKIRNSCRFKPSCSEYMILSIEKLGVINGVLQGLKRLRRCKPPYGGVDYP